jgi:hypothetical protein
MLTRSDLINFKTAFRQLGRKNTNAYEVVCLAIQLWDIIEKTRIVLEHYDIDLTCAKIYRDADTQCKRQMQVRKVLEAIDKAIGGGQDGSTEV